MNRVLRNIIIFLAAVFIMGMLAFSTAPDDNGGQNNGGQKKPIDSTISGARDLGGQWVGHTVAFTDRIQDCGYLGDVTLNLAQNGNNLNGNIILTVRSVTQGNNCLRVGTQFPAFFVAGTVSASAINLKVANTDDLKGSFTTDLMTLRWEKCKSCDSGPAMVLVGPAQLRKQG